MIFWLDNNENHKTEINENYGRELLELFSMGVGNYNEDDIKNAARAFTGWTFSQPIPLYPFGHYPTRFVYREDDHDDSEKSFLGETGHFNGEDIVEIIARQPATARFLSRHLYNFFVADEPQVPAWEQMPPPGPLRHRVAHAGLHGVERRHARHPACPVQLRFLQDITVEESEKSHRAGRRRPSNWLGRTGSLGPECSTTPAP